MFQRSVLLLLVLATAPARAQAPATAADLVGAVTDSTGGDPLSSCQVSASRDGHVVARTGTDVFGGFTIHNLPAGTYTVEIRALGFRTTLRQVEIGTTGHETSVPIRLAPAPISMSAVEVTATPIAINTRTGDQVFRQNDYHGEPTNTTSQILQQSIAGAVRAPTGEVHIRGQHAEYTYYVDGVPVPPGISGSLNELFDPVVANEIDFQTGGWDAEYGNKNTAIVNISTRIPAGGFHADASGYGGSFSTNGQSLNLSDNVGKLGWFVSGTRQETDMRQEPVILDPVANKVVNSHNHGEDVFGFGKLQMVPTAYDVLNLEVNGSHTTFQVPFDTTGGTQLDDRQKDLNTFANLGWRHRFAASGRASSELFAALFQRYGSLKFIPGATDQAQFIFFPDTLTPYNLSEDRSFHSFGTKIDYTWRRSERLMVKAGTQASATTGREDFETHDQNGNPGPASNSNLQGSDVGVYAEAAIAPSERLELRPGVRFDNHKAPFAGNRNQVSPRIRLNLYLDPTSTAWVYYGRLFLPTNVEDLRAITSVAQGDVVAEPTLPERDHFYEAGIVHRFPVGVVVKLSGYLKDSTPGIDDNTVPGSSIVTSVNLDVVHVRGLEGVLEVRPRGPVSGYLNIALNHAYGRGPITGGFFPIDVADVPGGWLDLDHDQRLSWVASGTYSAHGAYVSATGIYGSGLTNGADITQPIGLGLADFNKDIHVDPNAILNASAGYTLTVGNRIVRPQVYVDNVFDKKYLLKGAFFSGASVGRPRSVQVRLNVGL